MSLSDYIRSQAEWRRYKAHEYPDDKRNVRSAAALEALADYYDDESNDLDVWARQTLNHYAEVHEAGTGVPSAGEHVARAVARYGFDGSTVLRDVHHMDFLGELVTDAELDTYELVEAGTPDDDRSDEHLEDLAEHYGLNPWEVRAALDGLTADRRYFERRGRMVQHEQEAWLDEIREEENGLES